MRKSKLMMKLTTKFQNFKKQINAQIVSVYRECKEICQAAERGESDVSDDTLATTVDKAKTETNYQLQALSAGKLEKSENQLHEQRNLKQRGRPRLTSDQKELKRLAKDRGETIQIKGYAGKDYEQVFDPQGKAIGKKDAGGNFIPYKPRGRPIFKISKTIPSHAPKAKSSELEDMLN